MADVRHSRIVGRRKQVLEAQVPHPVACPPLDY